MRRFSGQWRAVLVSAGLAAAVAACGGESGPSGAIAAQPTSGDQQVAGVGTAFSEPLTLTVTQGGSPLAGQAVTWSVQTGATLAPTSGTSGTNGTASTTPTPTTVGPFFVNATVAGLTDPVRFTGFGVAAGATVVQVQNNTFAPASVTIARGGTVAWVWRTGSNNHNVVPDAGTLPANSGPVASGPRVFQSTFGTAGTYRYYCTAHGAAGGSGMSGTVIVN